MHGLLEKRLGCRGKITRKMMEKNHTPRKLALALIKAGCAPKKKLKKLTKAVAVPRGAAAAPGSDAGSVASGSGSRGSLDVVDAYPAPAPGCFGCLFTGRGKRSRRNRM